MEYTVLKGKEVTTVVWIKMHTNLHNVCSSPNIPRMIKSMCRRRGIESQEGQEIHRISREETKTLGRPRYSLKTYRQVYHGTRNRQCNSISEHAGHQERIYTRHQSLQKKHTAHYLHLQLNHPPRVKRGIVQSLHQSYHHMP